MLADCRTLLLHRMRVNYRIGSKSTPQKAPSIKSLLAF
jgi:hypothetical protein